jgi:hypothetical protein
LPIGSSFGQRRLAAASLITATSGALASSCSTKPRPRNNEIPIARR